ncbi:MAG: DUF3006 family protein [Candidatus Berkelbacteria bacterium]|nr:DUF3006 family protein [Candidatus Berkelbacteria bacterium]
MTNNESKLTFERIEGEEIVLVYGNKEIKLPKTFLPAGAKVGDIIQLKLKFDDEKTAKELLNQILGN